MSPRTRKSAKKSPRRKFVPSYDNYQRAGLTHGEIRLLGGYRGLAPDVQGHVLDLVSALVIVRARNAGGVR